MSFRPRALTVAYATANFLLLVLPTLALGPGSVITLDRLADQPVDLLVNGMPVARGEVVVIDDVFGLRVTQIVASVAQTASQAQAQVEEAQQAARDLAA